MSNQEFMNRRRFARLGAAAGLGALASAAIPGVSLAQNTTTQEFEADPPLQRRISGFIAYDWNDYFPNRNNGAILVDTRTRVLHFWNAAGDIYNVYPVSVPLTPELTRTGRTKVVQMRVGPDWRPTPNMLKRNPDLPDYVGPGPQNPLGTHAMYLSWTYYRIHGTNDQRKIGRKSSNGCIGLYNEDVEELFGMAQVGTQVLLI